MTSYRLLSESWLEINRGIHNKLVEWGTHSKLVEWVWTSSLLTRLQWGIHSKFIRNPWTWRNKICLFLDASDVRATVQQLAARAHVKVQQNLAFRGSQSWGRMRMSQNVACLKVKCPKFRDLTSSSCLKSHYHLGCVAPYSWSSPVPSRGWSRIPPLCSCP